MVKHFLKTLIIFLGMIILGLVGVFLVNYFDEKELSNIGSDQIEVAK